VLLPVFLPPVGVKDLKQSQFATLDLAKFQGIQGGTGDKIVEKVVEALGKRRPELVSANEELEEYFESPQQAAAICYKKHHDEIKFLLIRTRNKNNKERWIFPKSWVHRGEEPWLTAKLAARQEGGVAGDTRTDPIRFEFSKDDEDGENE